MLVIAIAACWLPGSTGLTSVVAGFLGGGESSRIVTMAPPVDEGGALSGASSSSSVSMVRSITSGSAAFAFDSVKVSGGALVYARLRSIII